MIPFRMELDPRWAGRTGGSGCLSLTRLAYQEAAISRAGEIGETKGTTLETRRRVSEQILQVWRSRASLRAYLSAYMHTRVPDQLAARASPAQPPRAAIHTPCSRASRKCAICWSGYRLVEAFVASTW